MSNFFTFDIFLLSLLNKYELGLKKDDFISGEFADPREGLLGSNEVSLTEEDILARTGPLASVKRGLPLSEKVAHGPVCAASSEGSTPEGHFYSVPVPERENDKNPTC